MPPNNNTPTGESFIPPHANASNSNGFQSPIIPTRMPDVSSRAPGNCRTDTDLMLRRSGVVDGLRHERLDHRPIENGSALQVDMAGGVVIPRQQFLGSSAARSRQSSEAALGVKPAGRGLTLPRRNSPAVRNGSAGVRANAQSISCCRDNGTTRPSDCPPPHRQPDLPCRCWSSDAARRA